MPVAEQVKAARTARFGFAMLGILLIAANLRVGFVSVGPLLGDLRAELGWSSATAGLLTGLPLVAFAAFSPVAPALARRMGLDRALWVSLLLLALGIVARSVPVEAAIWIGTAVLGAGIAFINVLLPSLVKRDLPAQVSRVTGIYTAAQAAVAAAGAAVVVPVAQATGFGWRLALGVWAGLALVALAVLLPRLLAPARKLESVHSSGGYRSPWKSALGWQITIFMGLQSLAFFVLAGWLPAIEQDLGIPPATSGLHVSVFLIGGMLASLTAGALLHRSKDQRLIALAGSILAFAAYMGMAIAPALALLWVVVGAAACGSLIVIALSLFSLRTGHHDQAAELSGMAQCVGYAIAAAGPVAFGALRDASGSWTLPLFATAGLMLVLCVTALLSGRKRLIG